MLLAGSGQCRSLPVDCGWNPPRGWIGSLPEDTQHPGAPRPPPQRELTNEFPANALSRTPTPCASSIPFSLTRVLLSLVPFLCPSCLVQWTEHMTWSLLSLSLASEGPPRPAAEDTLRRTSDRGLLTPTPPFPPGSRRASLQTGGSEPRSQGSGEASENVVSRGDESVGAVAAWGSSQFQGRRHPQDSRPTGKPRLLRVLLSWALSPAPPPAPRP